MREIKGMKTSIKIFLFLGMGILGFINLAEAGNSHIRIIREQGLEVRLDLSTQVLGLDIPEPIKTGRSSGTVEPNLYPTVQAIKDLPGWLTGEDFVSTSILVAKAKQFDDGLYAAVEYLCQDGTEKVMGKRELLQRVADALKELARGDEVEAGALNQSRAFILAAANLGGQAMAGSEKIQSQAETVKSMFLSAPLRSKPIGFYTWTEDLTKIFQQDRLLQKRLDPREIGTLAKGLSKDENALKCYQAYLSFVKKLTNPFPPGYRDLAHVKDIEKSKTYGFFPPSRSPEAELIKKLYGGTSIPDGFNLADELVRRIQNKEIDLTPQKDSGWYDYQIYALEPFVTPELMPEAQRLSFGDDYKKELINLFKGSMALTRETHIKQLETPYAASMAPGPRPDIPTIEIFPELSFEPTAAYYLRRARSYRFVRELLEATFGEDTLNNTYRVTASGTRSQPLLEELREVESLFYGAYQVVGEEIGMDPNAQLPERSQTQREADKNLARDWIRKFAEDPDVGADNRMMVPVFYDADRKKTKVWVVLGYILQPLSVWFEQEPNAAILDATGEKAQAKLEFRGIAKGLIGVVSREVYVTNLLNRDEFRALCDRHRTASGILEALESL